MAIIKCKMCGGDMELSADKTFGTCEYCGSVMTLPKISDEQRAAAFNRGNHFRRTGEFDKALAVYERIVAEDDTDAEAHWCCALCRFGIEYVEDPATYEYMPTCHRASFDSFLEDVDYLAAVEHSDGITRRQYQKDAAKIAEVQRGILATSQNEEPFDVFICYKETDENGQRTKDSIMAQDIYYQLTEQGRRVFFARITLEDKGGAEYEPYIFAALNSAKVMIAVGTRPEHFNAVWVKNEWSRFLSLMKKDHSKLLLPCYRDMDPYDLPEALSVLQSYDMSKIGFIQDLIRGVNKVLDAAAPKAVVKETVIASSNANVAPLLKRAFLYLEDGDWQSADEYCERVLDQDPENAEAYLGKLMAELKCRKQEALKDQAEPFDGKGVYNKVIRFGSTQLKAALESYNTHIRNRNENTRLEKLYKSAIYQKSNATTEKAYLKAAEMFAEISNFRDARLLADECRELAKEAEYQRALKLIAEGSEKGYRSAAEVFDHIYGYKDAGLQAKWCLEQAEAARIEAQYSLAQEVETDGDKLAGEKEFSRAIDCFERAIKEYSAIPEKEEVHQHIAECKAKINNASMDGQYYSAVALENSIDVRQLSHDMKIHELQEAIAIYEKIGLWKDSCDRLQKCHSRVEQIEAQKQKEIEEAEQLRIRREDERLRRAKKRKNVAITVAILGCLLTAFVIALNTVIIPNCRYNKAVALMDEGNTIEAYEVLIALDGYKDSTEKANSIFGQYFREKNGQIEVGKYITFGTYEQDNNIFNGKENIEWLVLDKKDGKVLVISKYALDCQEYSTSHTNVTWETCTLRSWLNSDFINAAFSDAQQIMIPTVTVSADKNPDYSTNPGNATQDQVFLLSITEVNKYFSSDSARQCQPTAYAEAQGASVSSSNGNCCWWLRSPGVTQNTAARVILDGGVGEVGDYVDDSGDAVRPAMWITIGED